MQGQPFAVVGRQRKPKINNVVEFIILLYHYWVRVIFDISATHSFIHSFNFAQILKLEYEDIETLIL